MKGYCVYMKSKMIHDFINNWRGALSHLSVLKTWKFLFDIALNKMLINRILNEHSLQTSSFLFPFPIQTFLEGIENQYTKRKTRRYVFSGFDNNISRGWEWRSATGRFVIMIQRIFPSWALEPTYCAIFIGEMSISLFSFINKVSFSRQ